MSILESWVEGVVNLIIQSIFLCHFILIYLPFPFLYIFFSVINYFYFPLPASILAKLFASRGCLFVDNICFDLIYLI